MSSTTNNPAVNPPDEQPTESHWANGLRSAAFVGFLAVLALAPLWYGGFGMIPVALITLSMAVLSLLYNFIAKEPRDDSTPLLILLRVPAICFAIIIVFALVQALLPVPAILANPVWDLSQDVLGIATACRAPGASRRLSAATTSIPAAPVLAYAGTGRPPPLGKRLIAIRIGSVIALAYRNLS